MFWLFDPFRLWQSNPASSEAKPRVRAQKPAARRGARPPAQQSGPRPRTGATPVAVETGTIARARAWAVRRRREICFGIIAAAVIAGAAVLVRPDWNSVRLAFSPPQPSSLQTAIKQVGTAAPDLEKTFTGCVRGATASALSAAVPAAPLAATGVLLPGSAALIVTASAIGCGVGAASTAATDGASWIYRKSGETWRWLSQSL